MAGSTPNLVENEKTTAKYQVTFFDTNESVLYIKLSDTFSYSENIDTYGVCKINMFVMLNSTMH